MKSASLYRGTISTIVLKLLFENERLYGYELVKLVKKITNDELEITEGALYPTLHKLENAGWVTTQKERIDNRTRKYYYITSEGRAETVIKIEELKDFLRTMEEIVEKEHLVSLLSQ